MKEKYDDKIKELPHVYLLTTHDSNLNVLKMSQTRWDCKIVNTSINFTLDHQRRGIPSFLLLSRKKSVTWTTTATTTKFYKNIRFTSFTRICLLKISFYGAKNVIFLNFAFGFHKKEHKTIDDVEAGDCNFVVV